MAPIVLQNLSKEDVERKKNSAIVPLVSITWEIMGVCILHTLSFRHLFSNSQQRLKPVFVSVHMTFTSHVLATDFMTFFQVALDLRKASGKGVL